MLRSRLSTRRPCSISGQISTPSAGPRWRARRRRRPPNPSAVERARQHPFLLTCCRFSEPPFMEHRSGVCLLLLAIAVILPAYVRSQKTAPPCALLVSLRRTEEGN